LGDEEVGLSYPFFLPLFIIMECQLKISLFCEKRFRKDKVKYINGKACCERCYWLMKKKKREERDEKDRNL